MMFLAYLLLRNLWPKTAAEEEHLSRRERKRLERERLERERERAKREEEKKQQEKLQQKFMPIIEEEVKKIVKPYDVMSAAPQVIEDPELEEWMRELRREINYWMAREEAGKPVAIVQEISGLRQPFPSTWAGQRVIYPRLDPKVFSHLDEAPRSVRDLIDIVEQELARKGLRIPPRQTKGFWSERDPDTGERLMLLLGGGKWKAHTEKIINPIVRQGEPLYREITQLYKGKYEPVPGEGKAEEKILDELEKEIRNITNRDIEELKRKYERRRWEELTKPEKKIKITGRR